MSLSWGLERISQKYGLALDELKLYYTEGGRIKAVCNDCPSKQKKHPIHWDELLQRAEQLH